MNQKTSTHQELTELNTVLLEKLLSTIERFAPTLVPEFCPHLQHASQGTAAPLWGRVAQDRWTRPAATVRTGKKRTYTAGIRLALCQIIAGKVCLLCRPRVSRCRRSGYMGRSTGLPFLRLPSRLVVYAPPPLVELLHPALDPPLPLPFIESLVCSFTVDPRPFVTDWSF